MLSEVGVHFGRVPGAVIDFDGILKDMCMLLSSIPRGRA